jgi:hypothetical protein
VPFTSLRNSAKLLGQNHFAEPNQHILAFLYPISIAGSHMEYHWRCSNDVQMMYSNDLLQFESELLQQEHERRFKVAKIHMICFIQDKI